MTAISGSGLLIGGGVAATVVVVGTATYFMVAKPTPQEAVTTPMPVVQTQREISEVPTQEQPKVTLVQPEPVSPDAEASVEQPEPVPQQPETTLGIPETIIPSFDLVRVDKAGATVVAGKAAPNTDVEIILNGVIVGQATADETGAFVALLDLEPSDVPRELELVQKQTSGDDIASVDKILIMPFKPEAKAAPKLIVAKPSGVEVIEPTEIAKAPADGGTQEVVVNETTPASATQETLSLDTIVYDDLGDVVISGRGSSDDFVRVYLDNKPTDVQKVADSGQWKITLPDVPEGLYALRVDSVSSTGDVTERVQSPFKREAAKAVVSSADVLQSNITIQPGYTLWAVAKKRYGDGVRYVQIFEANRDSIKDPDLIYPGQVFDLPN